MGTFKVLELTPIISVFGVGGASKWKKYVRLPQKHVLKNGWQLLVYEKFRFGYGVEGGGVISLGTPCNFTFMSQVYTHPVGHHNTLFLRSPFLLSPFHLSPFLPSSFVLSSFLLSSYLLYTFHLSPFLHSSFLLSTFQVYSLFLQSSVSQTNLDILNI